MKATNFAIGHSTAVFVLIACIIIGGIGAYISIPKEAAPDIKIPVVIVSTPYFGVSPADMETLVTQPLEKEFKSLRDLDKMSSTSAESVSLVTLEFDPEVDIDEALQKVRDKVDKAKSDLPADAEDPEIIEINASDWPILIANVSGDMDLMRLKQIGEDLQEDIEEVSGVLRVDLAGGVEREIFIEVDPHKLEHHKVSLNQVIGAVQRENVNLPGGSLEMGAMQYTVRVPGEFKEVPPLAEIVVKSPDSEPVFLKDVAVVKDGFKEPKTRSRLTTWRTDDQGRRVAVTQPNISLSVVKRAGENIIDIAKNAKEIIASYERRYSSDGLEVVVLNDMSTEIEGSVRELENNIISGLVIVLLVLFFFMGGARNALFVAISIPMSMLLSFLVLMMLGITMNMVVLFALILALGMLVDNALVVVENIYRHASEGKSRVQAAIDGTQEVGWAIIASTATTVAAFFPLLFWPGIMGEFMGYLPTTLIIVLLSSLFVALIINPTVCAVFLKVKEGVTFSENEVPDLLMYRLYRRQLEWALDHRLVVVIVAVLTLVGTLMLFGQTSRGVEFFPETTPEKFTINVENPDGTRLDQTDDVLKQLAKPLEEYEDLVDAYIVDAGVKSSGGMGGGAGANSTPHQGKISVDLVDFEHQSRPPSELMEELREIYADVAGANVVLAKQSMGPPTGAPVSVEIRGDDLQVLGAIAQEARGIVRGIPGIIDLQDDLELSRPEIQILVDRRQAALRGVHTQTIAQTVRTAINGTKASVFREGEDEYDVTVRLQKSDRDGVEDLEKLTVPDKDNHRIPLVDVATIEVRGGSGSIRHKDRARVVSVTANAAEGYLADNLLKEAQTRLEALELPPGYEIAYTGEQEDQKEAGDFLAKALLAAVFLILLILVTEFDSIVQPFIILCSVLLSLIGVFWSLIISGMPFGIIMTGIGVISLAGVVVNNAIVMIDYINKLRERGLDRRDAVITGGLVRFRPVMLTAITTIGGMIPLVVGVSVDFVNLDIIVGGNSVEMWGPMAKVVSGGLLVATILTLVVVPVLYSLFDDMGQFTKRLFRIGSASAVVLAVLAMAPLVQAQQGVPADEPASQPASEKQADEPASQPASEKQAAEGLRPREEDQETSVIDAERTLALDEARQLARQQNLDVRLAQQQVVSAEAQIQSAYSRVLPQVSASGNYIINQDEIAGEFPAFIPGQDPIRIVTQPKTSWNWEVGATLPLNARAWPGVQIAYGQHDRAEAQLASAREQIDFAATRMYYNLLLSRQIVRISRQQLASRRTLLRATQFRVDNNVATKFDLNRARVRVIEAEKDVEQARLSFIKARQSMANLLQIEADFDISEPAPVGEPQPLAELKQVAEKQRYSIEVEQINQTIASLAVEEVYYQYLPTLSTTFKYADSADTDLSEQDPQWQIIFGANWMLWDGGQRSALLDERQAQLISTKLQKERALDDIHTELDTTWADYRSAQVQVEASLEQVELAEAALEQAQIGYENAVATQLDLIDAQDQLTIAKINLARDRLQLELVVRTMRYLAGLETR
jgi:CzcA family heavy metal efflux pump